MAKPIKMAIVLNTRWGNCLAPRTFESERQALEFARDCIVDGFAHAYRIVEQEK